MFPSLSTKLRGLLLALAAMTALAWTDTSQAALLTYYNFNDSNFTSDASPDVTNPALQTTQITTTFAAGSATFPSAGSTVNGVTGEVAGQGLTLQNGTSGVNNGAYIQFSVSTLGFQNIALSYATRSSSASGFTTQTLQYSTNGTTFTTFATVSSISVSSFAAVGPFTLPAGADNQTSVTIRYVFSGGSTSSATSNNRLDNIQLNATPVPEPTTTAAALLAVGAICWHQRRRLQILARSLVA